jgi:hypothetical protein
VQRPERRRFLPLGWHFGASSDARREHPGHRERCPMHSMVAPHQEN